MSLLPRFYETV